MAFALRFGQTQLGKGKNTGEAASLLAPRLPENSTVATNKKGKRKKEERNPTRHRRGPRCPEA
uniref:Uncharacterized protein n=1 Tax=Arundo donax TaxID=35708 RepID=A0A0A9H4Q7_ARUDO